MKYPAHIIWILCTIGGMSFLNACKKDNEKTILSNSPVFDVSLFKSSIQSQLNGALGYAFIINQNGLWVDSTSFGIGAINAAGGGNVPASVLHDVNIASVTKTITGMAAIKLLEQRNVALNSAIGPWLPGYWAQDPAMSAVTFQELLTHTSGVRQTQTDWTSLKNTIANPLQGAKTYSYANANFALFRALLPKLNNAAVFNTNESNSTSFETWMSNQYVSIIQDLIFDPAGITNASCAPDLSTTTMQAFNESGGVLIPRNAGDWTELCGGGGFYLSTMEMARLMAYLAHTGNILTNGQKTTMDQNFLGWDPGDSFVSSKGRVYGKDGALFWDNDNNGSLSAGDSGLQTWVGKFPNGVELALSVTSVNSGWRNLPTMISNAYEAAWVMP